jgi:carbon-monoxide dehydrogenase medium subunit
MKAAPFDYIAAGSLEEALSLLARHGDEARPLAGGQSLVPMMALRLARPSVLVDLNPVASLAGIELAADHVRIGAMTRQADLFSSTLARRHAALLVEALGHVGHPPTRNRGTVGGSLAHADPSAELPVAMVALEARFILRGRDGRRIVPAADFFKGAFETALAAHELIVEIEVPLSAPTSGFREISPRKGDFAVVAAAARLEIDDEGKCRSCALVLGGVAASPLRCPEVEKRLIGRRLDEAGLSAAMVAFPLEQIETEDRRASRSYRRRIAPVIARRALDAALAGRGERNR